MDETWGHLTAPVTWCAGLTREILITDATVSDWYDHLMRSHGHESGHFPNCATCRDAERVMDMVAAHGAVRVLPSR